MQNPHLRVNHGGGTEVTELKYTIQATDKNYEIRVFDAILIIFNCLSIRICKEHGLNSFNSLCTSLFKKISNILNILLELFCLNMTYLSKTDVQYYEMSSLISHFFFFQHDMTLKLNNF